MQRAAAGGARSPAFLHAWRLTRWANAAMPMLHWPQHWTWVADKALVRSFADEAARFDRIGAWLTSAAPPPAPREYLHQVLAAGRSTADAQKKPRHIGNIQPARTRTAPGTGTGRTQTAEIAQRLQTDWKTRSGGT